MKRFLRMQESNLPQASNKSRRHLKSFRSLSLRASKALLPNCSEKLIQQSTQPKMLSRYGCMKSKQTSKIRQMSKSKCGRIGLNMCMTLHPMSQRYMMTTQTLLTTVMNIRHTTSTERPQQHLEAFITEK